MKPSNPDRMRSGCDFWDISQAANYLANQACTLSARHVQDGILRLQFNREVAYYARNMVTEFERGERSSDQALHALKEEQSRLLDQSMELTKKGIGIIAGAAQVGSGAAVCYASAGILCAFFGVPLIAQGSNNIYENGRNLIQGRSDTQGPLRNVYQQASRALGGGDEEANIAYGAIDLGTSAYGLGRMLLKPDAWRLFRYVKSDYIRAYSKLGKGALTVEALSTGLTMESMRQEFEKRVQQ